MIRSFIALELSSEIYQNLGKLIGNLKKGAQFTPSTPSWVKPESIHLTLKFLGNIGENMVEPISEVVQKAASETDPFIIRIRDLGVFPDERHPRVLWCGMTRGEEQTVDLQKKIDRDLEPLGFEKEKRPFHPHLTLARIKSLKGVAALMNIIKTNQQNSFIGECPIDRIILFRSELHPDGARYSRLFEASLRKPQVKV
ncbi:RNA 2',3'-cyclic phosphodiesterase [Candidatus Sumerlaeota bacterium]|nr:RNA 2',3'-cyclic phosphodiesterase [Candidatus Sumerlaeota bacterium]